ncbi:carbohydrate kinase family protein [Rhodobium gokarnense]|uniref:Sugar/nucleoside kinase (Ribokinase family) n=1 Tax=Rhodobium gokarnense TaxID=364296 RepID=A0ABT3HF47_9HYPH|nr:sugar kinase [Rhodobium gokarnense]MCW2309012.1 sugar/nucleoside kinase (ribokinase family) [Rhodobium gokarnense]
MAFDVSVVGLYILDVLGRPVDGIPPGGELRFIDEIRLTVAGTAGGTAVDCAKLGLKTRAVGAVGEDEKADFVLHTLQTFGVDVGAMRRLAGIPTSATILNVRPNGDRPALHRRGASDAFTLDEADYGDVLDAKFVHVGGMPLLAAFDGAPTSAFLKAAKEAGCTTTFDLLSATPETVDVLRPSLPYVDYFVPSIEDASAMSGRSDPEDAAMFFRDLGAGNCLITCGGEGCVAMTADTVIRLPAFDVDVKDTTGCGDAFTAGLIAGLSHDWDIEKSVRFASACGALVATGLGSDAGIVSFEETEAFMNSARERSLVA